jgi:hypothetical protein
MVNIVLLGTVPPHSLFTLLYLFGFMFCESKLWCRHARRTSIGPRVPAPQAAPSCRFHQHVFYRYGHV